MQANAGDKWQARPASIPRQASVSRRLRNLGYDRQKETLQWTHGDGRRVGCRTAGGHTACTATASQTDRDAEVKADNRTACESRSSDVEVHHQSAVEEPNRRGDSLEYATPKYGRGRNSRSQRDMEETPATLRENSVGYVANPIELPAHPSW